MAVICQTLRYAIDLMLSSFPAVGTSIIKHLAQPFRLGFLLSSVWGAVYKTSDVRTMYRPTDKSHLSEFRIY